MPATNNFGIPAQQNQNPFTNNLDFSSINNNAAVNTPHPWTINNNGRTTWTSTSTSTSTSTERPRPRPVVTTPKFSLGKMTAPSTVSTSSTSTSTSTTTTTSTTLPPEECLETITTVGGRTACAGELIFQDNFRILNPSKWNSEIKFAGGPDYEFVLYGNDSRNLYVSNKKLFIRPTLLDDRHGDRYTTLTKYLDLGESCTGQPGSSDCVQSPQAYLILPPVQSAQITTRTTFQFRYGTVEMRAKLPKGDWIYPELYLIPAGHEYGSADYASGAMRIAFLPGNANLNTNLEGGVTLGVTRAGRSYYSRTTRSTRPWSDVYHKFTLKWKPDSIAVYVDDEVYGKIEIPEGGFYNDAAKAQIEPVEAWKTGSDFAPFDKEFYLVLGVGAGGHVFPDTATAKPWKNRDPKAQKKFYDARTQWKPTWTADCALQVDYVNVVAL